MSSPLMPVVNRVPRLFHLLRAIGDALHEDLGVTTAMRGVMSSLAALGPRTVPELARERPVSRQHTQSVVNNLVAGGLAETRPNPAHRRSVLVALTDKGRRAYGVVRAREDAALAPAAMKADAGDIAAALRLFDVVEHGLLEALSRLEDRDART